jgi:hypothetical protein
VIKTSEGMRKALSKCHAGMIADVGKRRRVESGDRKRDDCGG